MNGRIIMQRNRGFTLIELMIVFAVIIALSALSLGAYATLQDSARRSNTQALVNTLATQITMYGPAVVTDSADPAGLRLRKLWDFDGDQLVDGYPTELAATADKEAAQRCGYLGAIDQLNLKVPKNMRDRQGRPLDGWGRPLHITFAMQVYGNSGIGIYSLGPDGIAGTSDDLTSWGSK
jgi:type II secretory pathway pseudopilin PulG